jgi:hypothetical protein
MRRNTHAARARRNVARRSATSSSAFAPSKPNMLYLSSSRVSVAFDAIAAASARAPEQSKTGAPEAAGRNRPHRAGTRCSLRSELGRRARTGLGDAVAREVDVQYGRVDRQRVGDISAAFVAEAVVAQIERHDLLHTPSHLGLFPTSADSHLGLFPIPT